MALDTVVPGNPDSVLAAADWLGYTLAPRVEGCAGALTGARNTAEADWEGQAGQLAATKMRSGSTKATDLQVAIVALAREIETFGHALRLAHERMAQIRTEALTAGLVVNEFVISEPADEPGAVPTAPVIPYAGMGLLPFNHSPVAQPVLQGKETAYAKAVGDAEFARAQLTDAADRIADTYRGLEGPEWALQASDIAGGVAGGLAVYHSSILRKQAEFLAEEAVRAWQRVLTSDPAVVGRATYYRDVDRFHQLQRDADEFMNRADDLKTRGVRAPLKFGAALAVVGVAYEISRGKDPTQAVASGTGGFLAGAAMGAGIGTLVPIPVVGTVAGAVIGAGVGIFASGAIDSLFEDGPDVGTAVEAGADAVVDTGKAIAGPVVGLAKGIGGLF